MPQVEGNPPSDDSPECSPENQSSSDSHQPNTNGDNSFSRHNKQHSRVMENCIALFLKFGAAASPTKTLSPKLKALIEQRLPESFPVHHRPDHLPYAAMIETAISTLNEKGGSSEEAISHFIRKENHDLPWAHDMFLKHHLENLCKDGSIFKTHYGLYTSNTDRVSTDAYPSISSSTSDIRSSFNSDSDANVSEIPKGRLSCIKIGTKMKRLKRMNEENESEEDTVDDGLTNTSSVKQGSDKDEEKILLLEGYEKVNRIKTKEKTITKQFTGELAIVALDGREDTVYKELSGAREEVVGQDQDDNVVRIQYDKQESEAQVKGIHHLIEDKPLLEETNQLQEHNVTPIREQCCVEKKDQPPKRNRKGQKARTTPAGRRWGKCSNDNETWVNELNEDQTLMEVLNAIKRGKKGKVLVEERTGYTGLRRRIPKEKEIVLESRKHEAFGAGKGRVAVGAKGEKQKQRVAVIGLFSSSAHSVQGEVCRSQTSERVVKLA